MAVGDQPLDRARIELRPVGEHDERRLDVVAESREAAAEARAGAERPVGARDDADALERQRPLVERIRTLDDDDLADRVSARRSST